VKHLETENFTFDFYFFPVRVKVCLGVIINAFDLCRNRCNRSIRYAGFYQSDVTIVCTANRTDIPRSDGSDTNMQINYRANSIVDIFVERRPLRGFMNVKV
jgi:hypothetical protein